MAPPPPFMKLRFMFRVEEEKGGEAKHNPLEGVV